MIKFEEYLVERNVVLTKYKNFVISYTHTKHFEERLKERAGIGLTKFVKLRVPKICKKIEENNCEPGSYAFVFTKSKFVIIAKFNPGRIAGDHDLFLITCLASSMHAAHIDHKVIVEYYVELFNVKLSENEAVMKETDEFENDFFVFIKENGEVKLDEAVNLYIIDIEE